MQIPQTTLDTAKPFFLAADFWANSMAWIGSKAFARLEVLSYHWQGHSLDYDSGRVVVGLPGGSVVLYPDLVQRKDFDRLLECNRHLAHRYMDGLPLTTFNERPTLYRRSGFRLWLPITCNVYYSPAWEGISSQAEAFDLGAVTA